MAARAGTYRLLKKKRTAPTARTAAATPIKRRGSNLVGYQAQEEAIERLRRSDPSFTEEGAAATERSDRAMEKL